MAVEAMEGREEPPQSHLGLQDSRLELDVARIRGYD